VGERGVGLRLAPHRDQYTVLLVFPETQTVFSPKHMIHPHVSTSRWMNQMLPYKNERRRHVTIRGHSKLPWERRWTRGRLIPTHHVHSFTATDKPREDLVFVPLKSDRAIPPPKMGVVTDSQVAIRRGER
jgi:hypothetical protein